MREMHQCSFLASASSNAHPTTLDFLQVETHTTGMLSSSCLRITVPQVPVNAFLRKHGCGTLLRRGAPWGSILLVSTRTTPRGLVISCRYSWTITPWSCSTNEVRIKMIIITGPNFLQVILGECKLSATLPPYQKIMKRAGEWEIMYLMLWCIPKIQPISPKKVFDGLDNTSITSHPKSPVVQ